MKPDWSKILATVFGALIIALQGATVKETSDVSSELAELTALQLKTVEAIRQTQTNEIYPELQKETTIMSELVEQGKAKQSKP